MQENILMKFLDQNVETLKCNFCSHCDCLWPVGLGLEYALDYCPFCNGYNYIKNPVDWSNYVYTPIVIKVTPEDIEYSIQKIKEALCRTSNKNEEMN